MGSHKQVCNGRRQSDLLCNLQRAAGTAGIQSVLIRGPGSSWQPMRNTFGAAWEINNAPNMPADLFVTSDDGQQVRSLQLTGCTDHGSRALSAGVL